MLLLIKINLNLFLDNYTINSTKRIPLKYNENNDESCPKIRKSKKVRNVKDFGPNFYMFFMEGMGENIDKKVS